MSFIYDDKNLINELIKQGLDFESRFKKDAQIANTTAPSNTFKPMQPGGDVQGAQARSAIALKMLNDIEESIDQATNPDSSRTNVTSGVDSAELTGINLEGLGPLVAFIVSNKIMVDFTRIAYDANETPPNNSYRLYNLESNAGFVEVADRSKVTRGYYINKDLLIKYLNSLQANAHSKKITVMEVQLKSLITQANLQLGTNINPEYQAPKSPTTDAAGSDPASASPTASNGGNNVVQSMHFLTQNLPLSRDDIEFERIRTFFNGFKKHLVDSKNPRTAEINNSMNAAERFMQSATAMTNTNKTRLDLNVSWSEVRDMLTPDVNHKYIPYLRQLQSIVQLTADVVANFYSMHIRGDERSKTRFSSEEKSDVEFQFLGGNSAKTQNLEKLQSLERDVGKATNLK